jgi:hypothetical protein
LPIPDSRWASAAELAREHGVFRTAKVLRLEYGKLKRLAALSKEVARKKGRGAAPPPAFLELLTPAAGISRMPDRGGRATRLDSHDFVL